MIYICWYVSCTYVINDIHVYAYVHMYMYICMLTYVTITQQCHTCNTYNIWHYYTSILYIHVIQVYTSILLYIQY